MEAVAVSSLLAVFRRLPRHASRALGSTTALLAQALFPRLRRTGLRNLELAFPESSLHWREKTLRSTMRMLGWQLAEFARMERWTRDSVASFTRMEGFENYEAANAKGRGVLVLTGHLGAWELSSYYFSLIGYPMSMVIRRLDNPLVDARVNQIRCRHGNRVLHKDDFARGLLSAMHQGETVGILMDTNMTPPQGVFVPYFGMDACTAAGMARVALKTRAAVVPGFMLWEPAEQKYVLRFLPEVELTRTGDTEADILTNTAKFNAVIESVVRQYPEQWLWLHRRWKTRPPGEPGLYE